MLAALALTCAVALPSAARAQGQDARSVSFGIGGGVSLLAGPSRSTFRNGFNGDASVRFDLAHVPLQFRAEFLYQNFDLRASGATASDTTQGTGTVLSGLAGAQLYLRRGWWRPYLVGEGGLYRIKLEPSAADVQAPASTRWGVNGGAGIQATIGGFSFYAEGRIDYAPARGGAADRRVIELIPLTAGVLF